MGAGTKLAPEKKIIEAKEEKIFKPVKKTLFDFCNARCKLTRRLKNYKIGINTLFKQLFMNTQRCNARASLCCVCAEVYNLHLYKKNLREKFFIPHLEH